MKKIKNTLKLVLYNWKPLVGFEVLYKLISVIFFVPLLLGAFNLAMHLAGFSYLTLENVLAFAVKPVTLLLLIVILLLAALYAMIDISAVVFTLDQAMQKKRVALSQIVRFALKNSVRIWRPGNILLVPVVLLLLPFVNIGLASGFITTISIPEFILDYILDNRLLSILFAVLVVFLTVLAVRWIYAFFYFTLEGCNFRKARQKSVALGKGRRIRDFLQLLLMQAAFAVMTLLLLFIAITLTVLISRLFSGLFLIKWIASTAVWLSIVLILAVIAALSIPFGYGCISMLYYRVKAEKKEPLLHAAAPELKENPRRKALSKRITIAFSCVVAAFSLVLGFLLLSGRINPRIEYLRTTEITAHRGASALYPENTMAAFRGAKELGADWVELDVQQSRDGQIFVMHDTNLKRTTGLDANTWETTWDEIKTLDCGSFFSKDFAGERIPLLSEVIDFAKENDMKLNIELKPTGHETDFEKSVVDIIRNAGFEDSCVITSQVYEVLENVKAYDESVTTVYVMSLAYGDINKLTAADHFSVEAMNATRSMISRVHNAGKELYVWTVNTKDNMDKMIGLNVDNLITDDIELAKQCVYESRYSSLLAEYIRLLR